MLMTAGRLSIPALTVDELAAVGLMAGATLPPMLERKLAVDDLALSNAIATRTLLARGLALLDDDGPALVPAVADALEPLLGACRVAELVIESFSSSRHVVAQGEDGRVLVLSEREPDVWRIDHQDTTFDAALRDLIQSPALWPAGDTAAGMGAGGGAEPGEEIPAGQHLILTGPDYLEFERLCQADRWDQADAVLTLGGVDVSVGRAWSQARRHRDLSVAVAVAHTAVTPTVTATPTATARVGGEGVYDATELRWLTAGPAGVWHIFVAETAPEEIDEPALVVIERVHPDALSQALEAMLEGAGK